VAKVAATYGWTDDDELEARVLSFLDDTVKDMNSHLYEFMRVGEAGIGLEDGINNYLMSAQVHKESAAFLVATSNVAEQPLVYLPWVHFQRMYTSETDVTGTPHTYTMFNFHHDGRVYLYPTPEAETATDFTLSLQYYRRIPLVSQQDPLDVPQEVETALVYGAQKRFAIHLYGAGHPDVATFASLEEQALKRLQNIDARHPDALLRFRLIDHLTHRNNPFNPLA
jgi:hypothetical protein